jgi:hypothetical protein
MKLHDTQNNRAPSGRDLAVVATPPVRANAYAGLFRLLECAVILSWEDLMPAAAQSDLIHIEYPTELSPSLEYLMIWSCTSRGYWNPVGEYWMCATSSHASGLSFSHGYHSGDLARMLDLIMQHQDTFLRSSDCHGLIQVHPPTEEERMAADATMKEAFGHAGSAVAELPAA